jgi:hypothetical protein
VCRSGKANNVKNCLGGGLFYHPILIRTTACNNDSSSFSVTTFLYSVCPPCRGVWVCTGWRGGDVPNYRAPLPVGHAYTVVVVRRTSYGDTSTFINICTTVVSPSRTLPAYRIFLLLHPHRGHYLGPSQLYSLLLHCSMLTNVCGGTKLPVSTYALDLRQFCPQFFLHHQLHKVGYTLGVIHVYLRALKTKTTGPLYPYSKS